MPQRPGGDKLPQRPIDNRESAGPNSRNSNLFTHTYGHDSSDGSRQGGQPEGNRGGRQNYLFDQRYPGNPNSGRAGGSPYEVQSGGNRGDNSANRYSNSYDQGYPGYSNNAGSGGEIPQRQNYPHDRFILNLTEIQDSGSTDESYYNRQAEENRRVEYQGIPQKRGESELYGQHPNKAIIIADDTPYYDYTQSRYIKRYVAPSTQQEQNNSPNSPQRQGDIGQQENPQLRTPEHSRSYQQELAAARAKQQEITNSPQQQGTTERVRELENPNVPQTQQLIQKTRVPEKPNTLEGRRVVQQTRLQENLAALQQQVTTGDIRQKGNPQLRSPENSLSYQQELAAVRAMQKETANAPQQQVTTEQTRHTSTDVYRKRPVTELLTQPENLNTIEQTRSPENTNTTVETRPPENPNTIEQTRPPENPNTIEQTRPQESTNSPQEQVAAERKMQQENKEILAAVRKIFDKNALELEKLDGWNVKRHIQKQIDDWNQRHQGVQWKRLENIYGRMYEAQTSKIELVKHLKRLEEMQKHINEESDKIPHLISEIKNYNSLRLEIAKMDEPSLMEDFRQQFALFRENNQSQFDLIEQAWSQSEEINKAIENAKIELAIAEKSYENEQSKKNRKNPFFGEKEKINIVHDDRTTIPFVEGKGERPGASLVDMATTLLRAHGHEVTVEEVAQELDLHPYGSGIDVKTLPDKLRSLGDTEGFELHKIEMRYFAVVLGKGPMGAIITTPDFGPHAVTVERIVQNNRLQDVIIHDVLVPEGPYSMDLTKFYGLWTTRTAFLSRKAHQAYLDANPKETFDPLQVH